MRWPWRKRRVDPLKIHRLEYKLGLRDDRPPPTGEPGEIFWYDPAREGRPTRFLEDVWAAPDRLQRQFYEPGAKG